MNNLSYFNAKNGLGKLACYTASDEKDIFKFIEEHADSVNAEILSYGGIVLRNFSIRSVSEFNKLANKISPNLLDYVNRSTPRTLLGGKIYTATEYPAHKHIPLHNENSYTLKWPNKIMFFCVVAPETGGETPIADSRQIYKKIKSELLHKFNEKKVMYVRHYISGVDLSWQNVYQTSDKSEVEKYCKLNGIEYHWNDEPENLLELTTKQTCQATIEHPMTKEKTWFNQAHLFHISALEDEEFKALSSIIDTNTFPRNSCFGDGSDIPNDEIRYIKETMDSEKIIFKWQKGDVMILDNMLMAHAREPFTGERKIVVAMGD
jgi:alpha-ketoglutarate-dependent taurine dioxygenase